jgi:hypothetical protein
MDYSKIPLEEREVAYYTKMFELMTAYFDIDPADGDFLVLVSRCRLDRVIECFDEWAKDELNDWEDRWTRTETEFGCAYSEGQNSFQIMDSKEYKLKDIPAWVTVIRNIF